MAGLVTTVQFGDGPFTGVVTSQKGGGGAWEKHAFKKRGRELPTWEAS